MSPTYPMFEKINIEELLRLVKNPSDETEKKAEKSAEDVLTVPGKALHQAILIANAVVDDVTYVIENQSLHIQAVDPSHVGMIQMCIGDDELKNIGTSHGLDLRKLKDITKNAKKSNKSHTDMITITKNGEILTLATPVGVRKLRNLGDMPTPTLPELDSAYVYDANVVELKTALKACRFVGDLFSMVGEDGEELLLSVKGSVDSCEARVGGNCLKAHKDTQTSQYSGTYLKLIEKIPNDFSAEVSFQNHYPLKISFSGEIAGTPVKGIYFLAPRVDNNADGKDSY